MAKRRRNAVDMGPTGAGPARPGAEVVGQFARFGAVGAAGFVVDTGVVYALLKTFGLYGAGAFAYLAAVSTTWWLNRAWTFRDRGRTDSLHGQWARFALANMPGLVLNRGAYGALVATSALCASNPVLAVAAGSLAGMTTNFILSRTLVFRSPVLPAAKGEQTSRCLAEATGSAPRLSCETRSDRRPKA